MSLLRNEDLLIWQLRTSYLTHFKDGVGERLINLDPSAILSNPALRAAGYGADIDSYRTYSPPIPTATTIAAEYFTGPKTGINRVATDELDGGMVTGRGSTETIGPATRVKRRRMREQQDEDDSSDLSDDTDEDIETNLRAAQSIKFAKMPVRSRADSSPMRTPRERSGSEPNAPEVFITHPTVRRTSSGNVETVRPRARRDTTTSSDMSSENEFDSSTSRRRVRTTRPRQNSNLQHTYTPGENEELEDVDEEDEMHLTVDAGVTSDASDMSSEFDETVDSESLLDPDDKLLAIPGSSELLPPHLTEDGAKSSPTKKIKRAPTPTLQPLPPPRPISQLPPISALGQALKAKMAKPKNPVEPFARYSGKGALDPLYIRIYAPFCKSLDDEPFDMPLQKSLQDSETGLSQTTVADAIGLALWRYHEEKLQPEIPTEKLDANRWELRMVDDGEPDYDFPPLQRTKNIVDFASNNMRPAGRGRGRGKAYDEFALVEASDAKYAQNKSLTPKYTKQFEELTAAPVPERTETPTPQPPSDSALDGSPIDRTVPKPFAFTHRKGSAGLADAPNLHTILSTPRTEQAKVLKIRFTTVEGQSNTCTIEFTVDTYLAEVLDNVCRRWGLDKAHHFLRVSGTSTTAPLDRTIQALGIRSELDLVRQRFAHDGPAGIAGSPASASPSAPLLVNAPATPSKRSKKAGAPAPGPNTSAAHPLAQMQDALSQVSTFKKYSVMRKQPMSFAPSHPRTLLLENEYLHILPGEEKAGGKNIFDNTVGKTTVVPFSNVVGSKVSRRHPKSFRVLVFKERETKRYDFEASSPAEAAEIVGEIQAKIKPLQGMVTSNFPLTTQQHNWG